MRLKLRPAGGGHPSRKRRRPPRTGVSWRWRAATRGDLPASEWRPRVRQTELRRSSSGAGVHLSTSLRRVTSIAGRAARPPDKTRPEVVPGSRYDEKPLTNADHPAVSGGQWTFDLAPAGSAERPPAWTLMAWPLAASSSSRRTLSSVGLAQVGEVVRGHATDPGAGCRCPGSDPHHSPPTNPGSSADQVASRAVG